jgi:nitrite reductase/ring-hydroxylating ferredoxin subunit
MAAGLVGGYGGFAAVAGRYLYPARTGEVLWQFVAEVDGIEVDEALQYRGPSGETINITRRARTGDAADFIALSSTCPHLGCQVRWEAQNNRFYCPCHGGVFDPSGVATEGPPAEAGQVLGAYDLKVERGTLRIAVPPPLLGGVVERDGALASEEDISGPGHDPCLAGRTPSSLTEPRSARRPGADV